MELEEELENERKDAVEATKLTLLRDLTLREGALQKSIADVMVVIDLRAAGELKVA